MRVVRLVGMCAFSLALSGCLSPGNVAPIDLEPGKQWQRELIREHFAGVDVRNERHALQAFRAGSRRSVSAAWWGFEPEDATVSIQSALDSGAEVVLIPNMENPWVVSELFVRSNTTLIIEDGVVLLAKRGSFRGQKESLLNLLDLENAQVYGYGALIRMRKEDYASSAYVWAQWRHAILIRGGENILIAGLTAEKSGGDGVYLGRGKKRITNSRIVLRDLILRDNYRQGISVITAAGLLIENVEMSGTSGTPPSAGIDFEPNRPDESITGCVLRNCLIRNNAGSGFLGAFQNHNETSLAFDITLDGCLIYDNFVAMTVIGFTHGARGKIKIMRNNQIYGFSFIPGMPGRLEIINK